MKRFRISLLLLLPLIAMTSLQAQNAKRFSKEISEITEKGQSYRNDKVILFTGSSTIRIWSTLADDFPGKPVVNHGFGGSHMSDLLYYADSLILLYNPSAIFIYEGDNDLGASKTPSQIIATADSLIQRIRTRFKEVPVYFISAKPSKARWDRRDSYVVLNRALKELASQRENVHYVDLWTPMTDGNGIVLQDIFIEDGLHMNAKGYAIWKDVIGKIIQ